MLLQQKSDKTEWNANLYQLTKCVRSRFVVFVIQLSGIQMLNISVSLNSSMLKIKSHFFRISIRWI